MKILFSFFLFPQIVYSIIQGISWFGLETEYGGLFCDKEHNYDWHLSRMSDLQFNFIRLPFSSDYIRYSDFNAMDDFFNAVQHYNISVVLDFHRLNNHGQSVRPYDDTHSFSMFIEDWLTILNRYKNNDKLVAVDIWNEYQPHDYHEWNSLAKQIILKIEEKFPNRFWYMCGCTNWSGDCRFVDVSEIPFQDRIFYTVHKYCWTDHNNLEESWDWTFGNLGKKIIVGEMGYKSDKPDEVQWFKRFIKYLVSKQIYDSFFWCWNNNSQDTGGVLKDDCTNVDYDKVYELQKYWRSSFRHLRSRNDYRYVGWDGCQP